MLKKIIKGTAGLIKQNCTNRNLRRRTGYAIYYKHVRVDPKMILYEAFFGRGMLCNPYAVFLELMDHPEYRKYRHVWVLDNLGEHQDLIAAYRKYPNVSFIQYQSREYLKYLCRAKYLINNSTFPSYFTKKDEQIYVNTWHGIPLKHLGYDMPNGITEVGNTMRNFLQADYLISACPFLTDIYRYSYKMENIYEGKIIEEGYPRLDILFRFSREEVCRKLSEKGMQIDTTKKIILYAPTWRGVTFGKADRDVKCYYNFKNELEKYFDTGRYQLLIKIHQQVYQLSKGRLDKAFFVPATVDANEVLAAADILISDFSSIFYDYLATDKPVLFYIRDAEEYQEQRGIYAGLDALPGPVTDDISELGDWISRIGEIAQEYRAKYIETKKYGNAFSDGMISRKIVDIVFNRKEEDYRLITVKHDREKIFISRGKMLTNGISSACLSLLNKIDYEQYDVTMMIVNTDKGKESDMLRRINPNVRVLYRNTTMNLSPVEQMKKEYREHIHRGSIYTEEMYRECKRCYGNAKFDYLIDYDGYSNYYATLLLHMNGRLKAAWQHNDMMAEKELRFSWLENYFPLYDSFDRIISCSEALMEINREKLGGIYCDKDKFSYARNTIDYEEIQEKLQEDTITVIDRMEYFKLNVARYGGCISMKVIPNCKQRNDGNNTCFVTVGRMSPEKNHLALIAAFHGLCTEFQNLYLYIIGDGPLKEKTVAAVKKYGLEDRVILTGNVANPFSIMKACDCFILPSLHEGQPMAIHEARVLHMPVIMSGFSSARDSLLEDGQLVIGTTQEEIYNGMKAYIDGKVPHGYTFDIGTYNDAAYGEFLRAIHV